MHTLELSFREDIKTQTLKDIALSMGYEVEPRAFDNKGSGAHFGLSNGNTGVFFIVAAKTSRRVMFVVEDLTPTWAFDEVLRFVTVLQNGEPVDLHIGDETLTGLLNAALTVSAKLYWREARPDGAAEIEQGALREIIAWNSRAHRHAAEYGISVSPVRVLESDLRPVALILADKDLIVPSATRVLFVNEEGRGKVLEAAVVEAHSTLIHSDSLRGRWIGESRMAMLAQTAKSCPGAFVEPSELRVVEMMRLYARKTN